MIIKMMKDAEHTLLSWNALDDLLSAPALEHVYAHRNPAFPHVTVTSQSQCTERRAGFQKCLRSEAEVRTFRDGQLRGEVDGLGCHWSSLKLNRGLHLPMRKSLLLRKGKPVEVLWKVSVVKKVLQASCPPGV